MTGTIYPNVQQVDKEHVIAIAKAHINCDELQKGQNNIKQFVEEENIAGHPKQAVE